MFTSKGQKNAKQKEEFKPSAVYDQGAGCDS